MWIACRLSTHLVSLALSLAAISCTTSLMPAVAWSIEQTIQVQSGRLDRGRRAEFEIVRLGEIVDEDGLHFASTGFRASDGTMLTSLHHEFESPLCARQYFDKEIAKAKKVVKREKKKDKNGNEVGERAQVLIGTRGPEQTTNAVLWTNGPHFYEILSGSSLHLLELESRLSR